MTVRLERPVPAPTPEHVRSPVREATTRRFEDADGVQWMAELRQPNVGAERRGAVAPMVLFSSDQRACLITLRPALGLGEMTTEELRALLSACLNG